MRKFQKGFSEDFFLIIVIPLLFILIIVGCAKIAVDHDIGFINVDKITKDFINDN